MPDQVDAWQPGQRQLPGEGQTACQQVYDTGKIGGGLTALGLAAMAGGMVMVALPGAKQQVQVSTTLTPSLLGMTALVTY